MTDSCNNIKLVRLKDRGHSIVAVFQGYGQELKIFNLKDGQPPGTSIFPLDPVCGVYISGSLALSDPSRDDGTDLLELRWPIMATDVEKTKKNLEGAARFCEEYRRRRSELYKIAGYTIK